MKKLLILISMVAIVFADTMPPSITQNGCLSCHAIGEPKNAPAFRGIANINTQRYGTGAKEKIIQSIRMGSEGKYPRFATTAMPPYPTLTQEEIQKIAEWILSNGGRGGNCNKTQATGCGKRNCRMGNGSNGM